MEMRHRRGGLVEHGDIAVKRWLHARESSRVSSHGMNRLNEREFVRGDDYVSEGLHRQGRRHHGQMLHFELHQRDHRRTNDNFKGEN